MTDERDGTSAPDDLADGPPEGGREAAEAPPAATADEEPEEADTAETGRKADSTDPTGSDGSDEPDGPKASAQSERSDTDEPDTEPGPTAPTSTSPSPARRPRGRVATAVSVGGELLITAGAVLALFVLYSLWWTNVVADREAARESDKVRDHWAADRDLGNDNAPKGPGELDTRDGIGFLHAPRLGKKEILVKPGTDPKKLNQGIAGYYEKPVKSAMPWDEKGNFSLAAHRDGHGAKFHNIHKLKDGDPLVFETKDTWYVYKVYASLPETSKYNVKVLDDVPKESGATEKSRYITLTTCTPMYTSNYRYVVWGELVRTEEVDADRTPPSEIS